LDYIFSKIQVNINFVAGDAGRGRPAWGESADHSLVLVVQSGSNGARTPSSRAIAASTPGRPSSRSATSPLFAGLTEADHTLIGSYLRRAHYEPGEIGHRHRRQ
jgi:hypothetical protein